MASLDTWAVVLLGGFFAMSVPIGAGLWLGHRGYPHLNGLLTALPIFQGFNVWFVATHGEASSVPRYVAAGPLGVTLTVGFGLLALHLLLRMHRPEDDAPEREAQRRTTALKALGIAAVAYVALALGARLLPAPSPAFSWTLATLTLLLGTAWLFREPPVGTSQQPRSWWLIPLMGLLGGLASIGVFLTYESAPLLAAAFSVLPVKTGSNLLVNHAGRGPRYATEVARWSTLGFVASLAFWLWMSETYAPDRVNAAVLESVAVGFAVGAIVYGFRLWLRGAAR